MRKRRPKNKPLLSRERPGMAIVVVVVEVVVEEQEEEEEEEEEDLLVGLVDCCWVAKDWRRSKKKGEGGRKKTFVYIIPVFVFG